MKNMRLLIAISVLLAAGCRDAPEPIGQGTANDVTPDRQIETRSEYHIGMRLLDDGDLIAGRALLSRLLYTEGALSDQQSALARKRLSELNQRHVLSRSASPQQITADPILSLHTVQSGEFLSSIANSYRTPYQLIERINGIDARRLQVGQTMQVIRGPVHARVDKSKFLIDLYVYAPDRSPLFLKSYRVGLGEGNAVPTGTWLIKSNSKIGPSTGGPSWRDPRTGEFFAKNNPDIPIGEHWIGLEGTDPNTKNMYGVGIHGTNAPSSIGKVGSIGCIRMHDDDIDEVFYTLFEGASSVEIVP